MCKELDVIWESRRRRWCNKVDSSNLSGSGMKITGGVREEEETSGEAEKSPSQERTEGGSPEITSGEVNPTDNDIESWIEELVLKMQPVHEIRT